LHHRPFNGTALTSGSLDDHPARARSVHTVRRFNDSDGWRLLVIISFTPEGKRRRLAFANCYRESKDSWVEVLLDLK